jgi:hypothetical protein
MVLVSGLTTSPVRPPRAGPDAAALAGAAAFCGDGFDDPAGDDPAGDDPADGAPPAGWLAAPGGSELPHAATRALSRNIAGKWRMVAP